MRVLYMGSPEFAVEPLRALAGRHEVVRVITRPDAASGRGRTLRPTPVARAAEALGLPISKPSSMRTAEAHEIVRAARADVGVVVAFGELVPADMLMIPRYGMLNVHPSSLPRWRGAAPVQRAILAGDETAGVSVMRVGEALDAGPYCCTSSVPLGHKGAGELLCELSKLGSECLLDALDRLSDGTLVWTIQDPEKVTYAEKVLKSDTALLPTLSAVECDRRVRASTDSAPARACVCGRSLRVISAEVEDAAGEGDLPAAGEVLRTRKGLVLGCAAGALRLLAVKPGGRREMPIGAFVAGLPADAPSEWKQA